MDLFVSLTVTKFEYEPTRNKLKNYFSYGVSVSRKLKTHIGANNSLAHSIAHAGWNETLPERSKVIDENCERKITVYGMSFSIRVAEHLKKLDPCYSVRSIAGPGAPLSHSYYMATKVLPNDDAEYSVLAILASSLPKITTMAHFNSAFEFPGAHMYPVYSVNSKGALETVSPAANSLNELRELLSNTETERMLKNTLREHDAYYSDFVYGFSLLDYSNVAKMLRRGFAQKNKREIVNQLYDGKRFTNHLGLIDTAHILVDKFVDIARKNSQTPIILLINDRGYVNALDELYEPYFKDQGIKIVSSTDIIDTADNSNFLSDGHFTSSNDRKLAIALDHILSK